MGLMIVGSNLPDADFIYPAMTASKLDYLLQHRGHSHTVIGAVIIALLMLGSVLLFLRYRKLTWSRADLKYLLAMVLLGPLLHLCLDFTNSYGLHPFWPVRNDWFYGDAVFIVEPLLWASATPLVFTLQTRLARALAGLAVGSAIVLSLASGLVPLPLAAALVLMVVLLAVFAWRNTARPALVAGVAAWLAITAGFFITGASADATMQRLLTEEFPAARTLDRVLTPMPVNPLCREVFALQIEGGEYIIRKATLALAPRWLSAQQCPQRALGAVSTAPLSLTPAESTAEIAWHGELAMPQDLIGSLSMRYCAVRALMHFARVPWAVMQGDGWIVGDMRYDREPEPGLAEIEVGPLADECPAFIPGWTPPRLDMLQ
jgi:inner membrane protein